MPLNAYSEEAKKICLPWLFDSTIWNEFRFRDNDIVIAAYPKSGTTWTQQIVSQLIFDGEADLDVATLSPWLDSLKVPKYQKFAQLEAQQNRRFIKTHLPADALVYSPNVKYIYLGRDGRDIALSLYYHLANLSDDEKKNKAESELIPESIQEYYNIWLDRDGYPFISFWQHINSWWGIHKLPNVLLVNFASLKRDLKNEIERIANFLEISVQEKSWESILEHCQFNYMKAHADKLAPEHGMFLKNGAQTFFNKGEAQRWKTILNPDEIHKYEVLVKEHLSSDCAYWLETGLLAE